MVTIFVSHVSRDKDIAHVLKERLGNDFGEVVDVFVSSDLTSVRLGSEWLDEIKDALKRSSMLLVLCSAEALERRWIHFECGAAWLRGIPVVPLCHSGSSVNDLPPPLNSFHGTDLEDPNAIDHLYTAIAEHTSWPKPAASRCQTSQRLVSAAVRDFDRIQAARRAAAVRRAVLGAAQLFLAPLVLMGVYAVALASVDRDAAGAILRGAAATLVWPFGTWFRLSRRTVDPLAYPLACVVIATLAGAGCTAAYLCLAEPNDLKYIFIEQAIDVLAFFVYVSMSFMSGVGLGNWLVLQNRRAKSRVVDVLFKVFPVPARVLDET